jgi:hypothetical protein
VGWLAELVRGSLLFKAGARGDPADQVGLASVAAAVQRAGGTVTHPAAALDDALDRLAASVEVVRVGLHSHASNASHGVCQRLWVDRYGPLTVL